ncbi:MAG: ATP-binding protein, partial [Thermodesulfovibrionales bacterium]
EEHHRNIMKFGEDQPIEYRILTKDGNIKWIRHLCKKIYNTKGEFLGIRGSNTDITTRKDFELQLMQQKEQLYITLESIGDGVISTDREGKIIQINKEAERLTEWTKEDAFGKDLQEVFKIVHEETNEPLESPVDRVIKSNEAVSLANHTVLISKSGKRYIIADSAAPIINNEGTIAGVVLVFRDVTEKRFLEAESLKASKLDSLSVLAGGIAHDFNNILTAIIGNISLCKYLTDKESKIYKRLDVAERSAERAKNLVLQLMTFAKGSKPLKKSISIKALIDEIVSFLLSGSRSICSLELSDDLWNIYADEGHITQVIHNVLINAEQAMPQGGKITIKGENVTINTSSKLPLNQGRYVKISISDTGIGIPQDKIHKVFDPYYTTKATGSGLGLASAYSIVKKHDGHIDIESKVGIGTTIHIYLPATTQVVTESNETEIPASSLKAKVLFMDDDINVFEVARDMLNRAGIEVIHAKDGVEAIEIYKTSLDKNEPFDLVILDMTIPGGMGGKDTIKELYAIDPSIKAIVTSGYSEDIIISDYKDYGFSGVVKKPFDYKRLISEVSRVLSA